LDGFTDTCTVAGLPGVAVPDPGLTDSQFPPVADADAEKAADAIVLVAIVMVWEGGWVPAAEMNSNPAGEGAGIFGEPAAELFSTT
jgi:hypothetical protein